MSKSKQTQFKKNLELSEKLLQYMSRNPGAVKELPKNGSFIVFTEEDSEINKMNAGLVNSVLKEGRKVIKATKKKSGVDWTFSTAS